MCVNTLCVCVCVLDDCAHGGGVWDVCEYVWRVWCVHICNVKACMTPHNMWCTVKVCMSVVLCMCTHVQLHGV